MQGVKYRRDIQVLRGLAVIAVVLFHASESLFPIGYLGVDVFFVISGFVVTPLILRIFTEQPRGGGRISNLKKFYIRRFYRLAPALAASLTISAALIFLLGPIGDHQRFARQGIATLFLAGNVGAYKYSGDYFSISPNPLVHTWSLSVEEQIYFFLPLTLLILLRNRTSLKKVFVGALCVISVVSFSSFVFPEFLQPLYSRAGVLHTSEFAFYSLIDRIWQFTVGGIAFLLLDQFQSRTRKIPKVVHSLTLIAVLLILFGPVLMSLKVNSFLASLIAVILISSKSLDELPSILIEKLQWVGDRSYSIYLFHMPLLYLAKYSPATQIGNSTNRTLQTIVALVAAVVLGSFSYSRIENKFRTYEKRLPVGVKAKSRALLLALVSTLILMVSMDFGVRNQYWGLDKNIPQPAYAGNLDLKCLRDTEIGPPCIYTNTGATKTVLLIGDSHALQISQAVVDAAKSANWNSVVWGHGNCPVQFQRITSTRVSENCISVNLRMKEWVEVNEPDSIIVSQFVRSDSSQNELRDALWKLRSLVPEVLLIENPPIFPDGKDFMVSRPLFMSPYNAPKHFPRRMMKLTEKTASNQLATWARDKGLTTLNFDSVFCNREICKRWSAGNWLYRDSNHFSVVGAAQTIPLLSNYLRMI